MGSSALLNNTEGSSNTAVGAISLGDNVTGLSNTAFGDTALRHNTIGSRNTAIGTNALQKNVSGAGNIAVGYESGDLVVTASNVISIGSAGADVDNSCYIGNIWQEDGGSQAVYVNASGKLGAQVSSRRFKHDIKPMEHSSEVIYSLNPVSFRYNTEIEPTCPMAYGLIAEDVEQIDRDLVAHDKDGRAFSVRYDQVNAMVLNEFLKEHRKNEQQEATIARQQKQIEALAAGLQKVSADLELSKHTPQVGSTHRD
jgi:hypothetical protein